MNITLGYLLLFSNGVHEKVGACVVDVWHKNRCELRDTVRWIDVLWYSI